MRSSASSCRFFSRAPDRFVAHGVHDGPFHDLACQQSQRPIVVALRRWPQACRDDAGLLVARQQLLYRRLLTLNAVECCIESLLDESLTQSFNGSRPTRVGLGYALVDPIWTTSVGLEQNLSTSHFLPGSRELFDNAPQLDSFLLRQPNDIQLPHGTPPCATQHHRSVSNCQPDFLAVTAHKSFRRVFHAHNYDPAMGTGFWEPRS